MVQQSPGSEAVTCAFHELWYLLYFAALAAGGDFAIMNPADGAKTLSTGMP